MFIDTHIWLTIHLFHFFQLIDEETELLYSKPYLRINVTSSATYECIAENQLSLAGLQIKRKSASIKVIGE